MPLFILIVITVLGTTLTISGGTVYLNLKSDAGGPVHWHADFEVWACGNELEVRDPSGFLSNKIGSPTLHEHNDKRIHLEGVPVELPQDASLGKFTETIGGELTSSSLKIPLNDGKIFEDEPDGDGPQANAPDTVKPFIHTEATGKVAKFTTGQKCGDQPSDVQIFVYNYDEASKTYRQHKLENPANYAISPHGDIPPGDCIIYEFGPKRDSTDKLCEQYGIRDVERCGQFGVTNRRVCEIKEVR